MSKKLPDGIKILSELEKSYDVINKFSFKKTSSWIDIKNYLYVLSLKEMFKPGFGKKNVLFLSGSKIIYLSVKNYIKNMIARKKRILYIGAGSGLFFYNNISKDSYFPYYDELNMEDVIYMISADHSQRLASHSDFLKKNRVVVYSYLVAPLKIVLGKFLKYFYKPKLDDSFLQFLKDNDINCLQKDLYSLHARFISSYFLFKIFLLPFKIDKAYVVSAYTNTALCAVLKEKGAEVIELQHGIIGSYHRGYNYKVSSSLLPTPDKVYVYNDFWKQELMNAKYFKEEEIFVKGRLKYDLIKKDEKINDNKFIVFTGQSVFLEEIKRFFNDSNEYLVLHNLKLIYIPHPNETENEILDLMKFTNSMDNIVIMYKKMATTEQYIYDSIAHISIYSSCHFDAVHYKNKTYILDIMTENPISYYMQKYQDRFVAIKKIEELNLDNV